MSIAVYDYDYMHYEHVIPNLECAKLVSYYRKHNQIAVLVPHINTSMYGQTFVRKDYDDGFFAKDLFQSSVNYGGRAFNPETYAPLDPDIERVIPDMHIYDKYVDFYGPTQTDQKQIKRILNAGHMRFAADGQSKPSERYLRKCLEDKSGIIFHDYNLGEVGGVTSTLADIQKEFVYNKKPLPIGVKFPISISSEAELEAWRQLIFIPGRKFSCHFILIIQFNRSIKFFSSGETKNPSSYLSKILVLFLRKNKA